MKVKLLVDRGLLSREGIWAETVWDTVRFDPVVEMAHGGNALMVHELTHVLHNHAVWNVFWLLLVVASAGVLAPIYLLFRRHCELVADYKAFMAFGPLDFRSFVFMNPDPKDFWSRVIYRGTRIQRCETMLAYADRMQGK